tara:strand:+ start:172 stop:273 length:102 start_codon:yes stop_codon:yes gene_type:complete
MPIKDGRYFDAIATKKTTMTTSTTIHAALIKEL